MIHFITFGSHNDFNRPNSNFIEAGERLINQAQGLELFEKITLYTSDDLKKDTNFWPQHNEFIAKNMWGYGWWIWKPYLIKKYMENLKDGDILLYSDCGCEINVLEKDEMLKLIETVKTDLIVASLTWFCIEKEWNKMDLILKLSMNDSRYINTIQRQATAILFLVCNKTRQLVNEWYEIACDYHLIDDSPSIAPNSLGFIQHRFDQAIFSLLTKKHNIYSERSLGSKCIWLSRNKYGVSKLTN
jgi:hypothetical protein